MNKNLELGYHSLNQNYGYYIDRVPQNVLEELKVQINYLQSDFSKGEKNNDHLAGEIQHEYLISTQPQTHQYIIDLTQQFEDKSQYMTSNYNPIPTLKLSELWVNFQKKYEYNPAHNHRGVYSFVIWYQIPFFFENELKYNYKPNGDCMHGKFAFIVPRIFNSLYNLTQFCLDIDKTKEGYIAIFPSNLFHTVYPFYSSDEYRITIAGNIQNIH
jgi:hypothetical protein